MVKTPHLHTATGYNLEWMSVECKKKKEERYGEPVFIHSVKKSAMKELEESGWKKSSAKFRESSEKRRKFQVEMALKMLVEKQGSESAFFLKLKKIFGTF